VLTRAPAEAPPRNDRNEGMMGRTHGEMNEMTPAANAMRKLRFSSNISLP
jgi:hypothetical protein